MSKNLKEPKGPPKTFAERLNQAYATDVCVMTRGGALGLPEMFTLITDPKHPKYADLFEPRSLWPLEEERIADLDDETGNGQINEITVWEDGEVKGRPTLVVVDGTRRVQHIAEINRRRLAKNPNAKLQVVAFKRRDGDLARMQLLKISANLGRENETLASISTKVELALRRNAPEAVQGSGNWNDARWKQIRAYSNLDPRAKKFFDDGRIPLGNILDIAKHPRDEQVAAIEAVLGSGAKRTFEVRDALQAQREGKPVPAPNGRKKVWGRKEITACRDTLLETAPDDDVPTLTAVAMCDLFLGDQKTLGEGPTLFEHIRAVVERLDKNGEARRAKARARHEKRQAKKKAAAAKAGGLEGARSE